MHDVLCCSGALSALGLAWLGLRVVVTGWRWPQPPVRLARRVRLPRIRWERWSRIPEGLR